MDLSKITMLWIAALEEMKPMPRKNVLILLAVLAEMKVALLWAVDKASTGWPKYSKVVMKMKYRACAPQAQQKYLIDNRRVAIKTPQPPASSRTECIRMGRGPSE